MRARRGLPIVTLITDGQTDGQHSEYLDEIDFLPNAICRRLGVNYNKTHSSLAHSSGFYTSENLRVLDYGLECLRFPDSSSDDLCKVGRVRHGGRNIDVFGGYGDLQASIFGECHQLDGWVINLGTGSQLIRTTPCQDTAFEVRKYFSNETIYCASHIPAGRALNAFAKFTRDLRQDDTDSYFWKKLSVDLDTHSEKLPAQFSTF